MSTATPSFSAREKAVIVAKIQKYFNSELAQDIGGFEAEFLLDFFTKEIGNFYYNRGLYDAQAVLSSKMDDLNDAIYQLEKETDFKR